MRWAWRSAQRVAARLVGQKARADRYLSTPQCRAAGRCALRRAHLISCCLLYPYLFIYLFMFPSFVIFPLRFCPSQWVSAALTAESFSTKLALMPEALINCGKTMDTNYCLAYCMSGLISARYPSPTFRKKMCGGWVVHCVGNEMSSTYVPSFPLHSFFPFCIQKKLF